MIPKSIEKPTHLHTQILTYPPYEMDQTIYSIKRRFPRKYGDQKCENPIPVLNQKLITSALMQSQVKVVVGQKKQVNGT